MGIVTNAFRLYVDLGCPRWRAQALIRGGVTNAFRLYVDLGYAAANKEKLSLICHKCLSAVCGFRMQSQIITAPTIAAMSQMPFGCMWI